MNYHIKEAIKKGNLHPRVGNQSFKPLILDQVKLLMRLDFIVS